MTFREWLAFIEHESAPAVAIRRFFCYAPVFTGRATRLELFVTVGAVLTGLTLALAVFPLTGSGLLTTLNGACLAVLVVLPLVSVALRRLHDVGQDGWMLMVLLVPYVGPFILLLNLLGPGQEFDNAYGPSPYI